MKRLYVLPLFLLFQTFVTAQTIMVSGKCMSGSITLNKLTDNVDGKVAYSGSGTVAGLPNTSISIYWIGAPDNVWVLAFDGQPFFSNSCNKPEPPGSPNASCPWTELDPSSCPGSTALSIGGSGVLPISLSGFGAKKVGQGVVLSWKTLSEQFNKGFEVQRSRDGIQWSTIGFVKGSGTTSSENLYQFDDVLPLRGKNFYRLQQIDVDNRSVYSSVVIADFGTKGLYNLQNMANGKYRLMLETTGTSELKVVDISGKRVLSRMAGQGVHQLDISGFAPGIYILEIMQGKQSFVEKLIKQ